MKVVIQRVKKASVVVDKETVGVIKNGLLLLAGFEVDDNEGDIEWISGKILRMRIFDDTKGIMNLSILDTEGDILVVSQFTLHASTKKGNRPSYIKAAPQQLAVTLYKQFIEKLKQDTQKNISSGIFGAVMQVELINDGPVTIIIDSKNRV